MADASCLQTRLCDLLGLRYPIVQAGMAGVAGPELVAAVSEAGGLGVLGGFTLEPDELRRQIRAVKELTRKPFGVNLWTHPAVTTPGPRPRADAATMGAVCAALNAFRATMGLPAQTDAQAVSSAGIAAHVDVVLEEHVPVLSVALGDPGASLVERCHERGTRVMAMITTVEEARTVARAGVDLVVAQGSEAGGHHSTWTTRTDTARSGALALLPEVVDAVDRPVLVAGGIADGRGIASVICLGASGVVLGTRFVATREARAPEFWKAAIVKAGAHDTVVTTAYTGLPARAIRNAFSDGYAESNAPTLPPLQQKRAAQDIFDNARANADTRYFPMWAGQSVGVIHDIPSAREIVQRLITEATQTLQSMVHDLA
jgi:nitronate monooxygenase